MSITNSEDMKIILANRRKSKKNSWASGSDDGEPVVYDADDRLLINDIEHTAQRED